MGNPELTEFHKAATQVVFNILEGGAQNAERLATMAKAQVVSGYAVRRIVQRAHMLNKAIHEFSRAEVEDIVIAADKLDQQRGLEDGIDQTMIATMDDKTEGGIEVVSG